MKGNGRSLILVVDMEPPLQFVNKGSSYPRSGVLFDPVSGLKGASESLVFLREEEFEVFG
jgi:hypothetical protein